MNYCIPDKLNLIDPEQLTLQYAQVAPSVHVHPWTKGCSCGSEGERIESCQFRI